MEKINDYLDRVGTKVYDMPLDQLELIMDNHKCITWEGEDYFIPDTPTNDDDLIHEFLISCRHV